MIIVLHGKCYPIDMNVQKDLTQSEHGSREEHEEEGLRNCFFEEVIPQVRQKE